MPETGTVGSALRVLMLAACVTSTSPAAIRLSSDQIATILDSGLSKGQTDAQVARSLARVEAAERITEKRKADWLARAPGPRTRDVLRILADASAFLPAAPRSALDAPSEEQQGEVLSRAREYTVRYISALPDFVCTRLTRRFDDYPDQPDRPEVWQYLRLRDTFAGQLTFNRGVESYAEQTAGTSSTARQQTSDGLTSFGEFGSIIGALFIGDSRPEMTWGGWETIEGKRLAVVRYAVPASRSRYNVTYCCFVQGLGYPPSPPETVVAGYRGELYVDPASGGVWRVTREAVDLPSDFPTRRAATIVDYRMVQIGAALYLCPIRSTTSSDSLLRAAPRGMRIVHYLNDVRFVHYHRFGAESKLVSGEATPATATPQAASQPLERDPWLELDLSADQLPPSESPAAAPASQPARPGVTIRTFTQLVEVPVVVKEKSGEPVTGLRQEDFAVYDNGKLQEVRLFPPEGNRQPGTASSPSRPAIPDLVSVSAKAGSGSSSRNQSTVILIDVENTDWEELVYARMEVAKLLRQLPPGESVGLYLMHGRFTALAELGSNAAGAADAQGVRVVFVAAEG